MNLERSEQFSFALADTLRLARVKKGISQNQLSKLSGVSRAMINHLESGKRNPTVIVCHALVTALELRLSSLVLAVEKSAGNRKV